PSLPSGAEPRAAVARVIGFTAASITDESPVPRPRGVDSEWRGGTMNHGELRPSMVAKPHGIGDGKRAAASKIRLLELARRLGSVSKACEMMDNSRNSYYRFKKLYWSG